jgi:hypothetical protein
MTSSVNWVTCSKICFNCRQTSAPVCPANPKRSETGYAEVVRRPTGNTAGGGGEGPDWYRTGILLNKAIKRRRIRLAKCRRTVGHFGGK